MSFENIIGNEKNKEFLNKIIDSNSTVHSYMFEGIEGIGKSIFAKEFAKMLLCIGNDKKNCARCKSCLEFVNSNNPDYVQIDSDGKIIKIEQIRQMQEKILEKPIVSSKKVYVINDADLMTKEAQNCLLKTLEEPPEFVIIILVLANESKILNTVKSRCMRIFFSKLKDEELKKYAYREYNEAEIKEGMIKNASGSISKFIKIKENFDEYENLEELVKKLKTDNILDIINNCFKTFNYLDIKSKKDILRILIEDMQGSGQNVEVDILNTKISQNDKRLFSDIFEETANKKDKNVVSRLGLQFL